MNQATETALEALKVAIEAGETEAGVKAVQDYKDSQAAQPAPSEPAQSDTPATGDQPPAEPAEPAATAIYSQTDYDAGIAAAKQAMQALVDAASSKYDAEHAKNEQLKDDMKQLRADLDKADKDAE